MKELFKLSPAATLQCLTYTPLVEFTVP